MLSDYFKKPASTTPHKVIPSNKTSLHNLVAKNPTVIWFRHSSYMIKSKDFTLLVDPVLSGYASPFSFFAKSFNGTDIFNVDDFPSIDLLVITHDHYDHLDFKTVTKLNRKVRRILTPLGVGAHLEYWGIESSKIVELDWWETAAVRNEIQITATPARHFSGRGLTREKTLWASYVLFIYGHKLFLGGDSGYDKQFVQFGEKYGPFDLAILDCGQYGANWPYIHMQPEETVKAAKELNTKMLMPVHWGKFALANHPWNEPIKRIEIEANKFQLPIIAPQIGEPFYIGESMPQHKWWNIE